MTVFRSDLPLFETLSFSIKSGEAIQLSGTNGIGKTSLLRCLCGLSHRHEGEISWNQLNIEKSQSHYYQQLLYLGHSLGLKPKLTIEQNLYFYQKLRFSRDAALVTKALKQLNIDAYFDEPVAHLSAGQKRRVALARIITEPVALWILDEPMVALDTDGQAWLESVCNQHLTSGGMIILTSHQKLTGIKGLKELVLKPAQFKLTDLDEHNQLNTFNTAEQKLKEKPRKKDE